MVEDSQPLRKYTKEKNKFECQDCFLFFFLIIWKVPMLVKEAIIKVARDLKKDNDFDYQDQSFLQDYPDDLTENDIKKAMIAVASVSDSLLKLQ